MSVAENQEFGDILGSQSILFGNGVQNAKKMKVNSLMYHDIVESEKWDASGFAGSGADVYKLNKDIFSIHLQLLSDNNIEPKNVFNLVENKQNILVTFDDGGVSAYTVAADILEAFGWRGHFFVATDFIDTPNFLSKKQVKELHQRGHIIGSHSATHPTRFANCSDAEMLKEWSESLQKLSEIIDEKVEVASVPGGYFSKKVAETASQSGIKWLFNSEPLSNSYVVDNCQVFGRFTIQQNTSLQEFNGLVKDSFFHQKKQYALWNSKKIAKKIGGKGYLKIREKFFTR
jgi:peptidoglycan/xylan/chitin deacetylase (PgdA/CDA1 family)